MSARPLLWVHFSRPVGDEEGPTLGPFKWVEVAYLELRSSPKDGPLDEEPETIAFYEIDQGWRIIARNIEESVRNSTEPWTGFVIYAGEKE